jgi:hypothetical protein
MLPHSPRFSQAVDSFLLYCESKNLTPGTIGWYGDKLADVTRLLDDPLVAEVSLDDLRRLVAYWTTDHRLYPQLAPRDKGTGLYRRHYDAVRRATLEEWSRDPFSMEVSRPLQDRPTWLKACWSSTVAGLYRPLAGAAAMLTILSMHR